MKLPVRGRVNLSRTRLASLGLLIGAQVVNLLGIAVVTRLYSPAEFGTFATLFAIASIVGGASSLRLDVAATTAPSRDARVLFRAAGRSSLAVAAGAGLTAMICYAVAGRLDPRAVSVCVALAAVTAGIGAAGILTYARVRQRSYLRIAGSKLLTAVVQALAQSVIGVLIAGPAGLLAAAALGYGAGLLLLVHGRRGADQAPDPGVWEVLGRYRGFVFAAAPAGLISALAVNLPVLATGTVLGSLAAADLALALRIGALPSALFGQALMPILFGEIAHRLRTAPSSALGTYDRALVGLAATGAISVTGLAVATWLVAPVLFGPQWRGAGVALLLLTPYLVSQFAVSPVSQSLNAVGRNAQQLWWDVGRLVVTAGVFAGVAAGGLGLRSCLVWFSVGMVLTYAVHVLLSRAALAAAAAGPITGEGAPARSDAQHAYV